MFDDKRDSHLLWANRSLLKVTRGRALRDLQIACFPDLEAQSLEAFSSQHGYYLIESPRGDGDWKAKREAILRLAAPRIFRCELAELPIPMEQWPDADDFETFRLHFTWEFLALTADFGTGPITTSSVTVNPSSSRK